MGAAFLLIASGHLPTKKICLIIGILMKNENSISTEWIAQLDELLRKPWGNHPYIVSTVDTRLVRKNFDKAEIPLHMLYPNWTYDFPLWNGIELPTSLKELYTFSRSLELFNDMLIFGPPMPPHLKQYTSYQITQDYFRFYAKEIGEDFGDEWLVIGNNSRDYYTKSHIVINLLDERVIETQTLKDVRVARKWPSLSSFLLSEVERKNKLLGK